MDGGIHERILNKILYTLLLLTIQIAVSVFFESIEDGFGVIIFFLLALIAFPLIFIKWRADQNKECTLYASHSTWKSQDDFIAWTKSEAFKLAHKNAGQHRDLYLGAPNFEGFEVVI